MCDGLCERSLLARLIEEEHIARFVRLTIGLRKPRIFVDFLFHRIQYFQQTKEIDSFVPTKSSSAIGSYCVRLYNLAENQLSEIDNI